MKQTTRCKRCNGSGFIIVETTPDVLDQAVCRDCNGVGEAI